MAFGMNEEIHPYYFCSFSFLLVQINYSDIAIPHVYWIR